jgi:hypothetical protein
MAAAGFIPGRYWVIIGFVFATFFAEFREKLASFVQKQI